MPEPNSHNLIASRLHELSSFTKLFIIGIFWIVINFGQQISPGIHFNSQHALSIIITITFITNLVTELIIYFQKRNFKDFRPVLITQIIINTPLLMAFLMFIDHINGPLFLICVLTLMESSLNLSLYLPQIIVAIMGIFTVVEWIYLVQLGQITPDPLNVAAVIVRIIVLVFLMAYGKSFAESIVAAREVDKMKDNFISIASHELRTPMTAIKSYIWMALSGRGGPLKPKQKFYLRRSYDSTDRLIKLVNDMLNISRIESGRISLTLEKTQVADVAKEVASEFSLHRKNVKIVLKTDDGIPPYVIADADKIKEIFFNLIGNSLKYTPKNGNITIDFHTDSNFLVTRISDNGSGMTPEVINNLFQKFGLVNGSYQTNQSADSKGTGLGLYICKQIITLHHGEIWGDSPGPGLGSSFCFSLPLYTPTRLKIYQRQFSNSSNIGIIHSEF